MKKKIQLTGIIFLSLFIVIGCYKEDVQTSNSTKKQSALTDLFKNIAPPKQNFSLTAGQTKTIVGEKGTNITFYANSFKKKDGTILSSGTVSIVLQEMLTGPEMILANKTTTSNGRILISGGQIFIKAFSSGEELLVNQNAQPLVKILDNNLGGMSLFKGVTVAPDSIVGDTAINWELKKDSVIIKMDSIYSSSGVVSLNWSYSFGFEEFGYYNCDQFYNINSAKTEMKIKVPDGFDHFNTQVYIYFKSINSVIKCEGFDKNTNTFFLNHSTAPIGLNVTIVVVGKKDNVHYLEVTPNLTITDGYMRSANPAVSSEAAIKLAIKAL